MHNIPQIVHLLANVQTLLQGLGLAIYMIAPPQNLTQIDSLLQNLEGLLRNVGLLVCVVGIMVGGLMRATAFGNERKIATSNMALSCAVVGFVIVLVAQAAGSTLQQFVGAGK